ncbi:MAG: lipid A export permease/ATP-binding protein MsbA [Deltaproteobacteria bacterium]|nr:lipid A export permease/ATP-binding protein MsbA [Deltaproteobacteria bacterium]MBW2052357.1 lipid A export permease/ATP-binding protein MsbA [Deltaproteobacteria bacterium]MBW2139802.1 lipid A export permease/ATP-binding protein MsbA [Deltaproteobacteria bacterium]MBW2322851.1 lipid A export permease/ATP-binding protein MsbA [Deltaproteobacteria bacterium]
MNNYQRLITHAKPYWWRLLTAMISMGVVAASTAAIAFLIKPMLDQIFLEKDVEKIYLISALVVGAFIIKAIFYLNQAYQMSYVGQTIVNNLRVDLYRHLQTLSMSFFHRNPTGVLTSRITNDVNMIQHAVSEGITAMIMDTFTAIGLMFVIFYRDWKLALVGIIIIPMAAYPLYYFGRKLRTLSKKVQINMGSLTTILQETFQGVRIVKAFNMEEHENKRLISECDKLLSNRIKVVVVRAISSSFMEILAGICIAGIILYGGVAVVKGLSTPGSFVSFLTALILLYDPIKRLSRLNVTIQQGFAAADRVFVILDEEPEIKDADSAKVLPPITNGVEFKNVHFGYGQEKVLKGINLTVKGGEALAIVGASGVGKTTLVNLIPRFYDVQEGAILIDGYDIRDVTLKSLRAQISIVSQVIVLFDDTVFNNIAYGSLDKSKEEIVAAAKAAYAYDFIKDLPEGFDTRIGERGVRLSGGERQRLAMARAILKDAPVLILDEATSSLDAESELIVQKALLNLMQGRTTFVIAHRLSTVRNVNRIIVLGDGQIIEEGTHEQLLASGGEYRRLYEMQFREYGRVPGDDSAFETKLAKTGNI